MLGKTWGRGLSPLAGVALVALALYALAVEGGVVKGAAVTPSPEKGEKEESLDPGYGLVRAVSGSEKRSFGDYVFTVERRVPVPIECRLRSQAAAPRGGDAASVGRIDLDRGESRDWLRGVEDPAALHDETFPPHVVESDRDGDRDNRAAVETEGPDRTRRRVYSIKTDLDKMAEDIDWVLGLDQPSVLHDRDFTSLPKALVGRFEHGGMSMRHSSLWGRTGSAELTISAAREGDDVALTTVWRPGDSDGRDEWRIALQGGTFAVVQSVGRPVRLTTGETLLWQAEIGKNDTVTKTITYAIAVEETPVFFGVTPGKRTVWEGDVSAYREHLGVILAWQPDERGTGSAERQHARHAPVGPPGVLDFGGVRGFHLEAVITNRGPRTVKSLEGVARTLEEESDWFVRLENPLGPGEQVVLPVSNARKPMVIGPARGRLFLELRRLDLGPH